MTNTQFMQSALKQAAQAAKKQEVPVGAVLVRDNKIITRGHNLTKTKKDPTAHAEIVVIRKAIKKIKNERFLGTTLYVTLEPCAMCAGAIIQARIPVVVFGTKDHKAGACGSVLKILPHKKLNHRPKVVKGILKEACSQILKDFFKKKRFKR